jgi:hypothetical protein
MFDSLWVVQLGRGREYDPWNRIRNEPDNHTTMTEDNELNDHYIQGLPEDEVKDEKVK